MADVVISEFMDEGIVTDVLGDYDVIYDPTLVDDRKALFDHLVGARAIIVRNRTQVDAELVEHAGKLEVVGRLGVGLDNIDLDSCAARNVTVCPATGANDLAVAEYAIAATLILLRGVWQRGDQTIAGEWPRTESMGRETAGKRLGLVGFGSIARQVATRARALGMEVAAFDPYLHGDDPAWEQATQLSLDELAAQCDVISIHVPLTKDTLHLVDEDLIRHMRRGAILVNSARGGVVDEKALVDALREGRLGGAALDVFESEPLDTARGELFAGLPNLLLTPHIAGITEESNQRVSRLTAENVVRQLQR